VKRILVTGGCGFIGSNFIRYKLAHDSDCHITNLDALTYAGNPENLRDVERSSSYKFVHGNICDQRLVRSLMVDIDGIVHFAAETHVDRSIDSADDFIRTNVIGTQTLLDAALNAGRIDHFIYFSTDEVYGPAERGAFPEDAPAKPTSPYAASKASADLLALSYYKTHKLPVTTMRASNGYGPYQYPEKLIPLFVTNLVEKKKIPLYSHGENVREWIYVEDIVRAILLVMERGKIGEVYNVGSDFETSNLKVAKMILTAFGLDESWISYVKDRPAHDIRYRLDSGKIALLGFKVSGSFERKLQDTIEWYQKNEAWWKPLKNNRYTVK